MGLREDKIQAIIDEARSHAVDGAHYLWGGAGNTPGESDGAKYRPSYVRLHPNIPEIMDGTASAPRRGAPFVPTMFAAWAATSDKGNLVCNGRAAARGDLPLVLPLSFHDAFRLKLKNLTADQIEEMKKRRGFSWQYRWPRPKDVLEGNDAVSTVWGECCIDRRHFDCIGLINYCFSKVLNMVWQFGIESFTIPAHAKAAGFREVTPISSAQPGDILTFSSDHIGIVSEKGTAIEAKDPGNGVVELPVGASRWTQCWRVPDGGLGIKK